jgi:site-specific recombinase XerD
MTSRLAAALKAYRHLRGDRLLYNDDGSTMTEKILWAWVGKAAKRAALGKGNPHKLRHTFCSHLAMRGAPAKAIQELAGHADLSTTLAYMHLLTRRSCCSNPITEVAPGWHQETRTEKTE